MKKIFSGILPFLIALSPLAKADLPRLQDSYEVFETPSNSDQQMANELFRSYMITLDGFLDDMAHYEPPAENPYEYVDGLLSHYALMVYLNETLACHTSNPVGNLFQDLWNNTVGTLVGKIGHQLVQLYGSASVAVMCQASSKIEDVYFQWIEAMPEVHDRWLAEREQLLEQSSNIQVRER